MINANTKQKSLLLVEDEVIIAMAESLDLKKLGYKVTHVTSGKEAIDEVLNKNKNYDLILMDIDLKDKMDGTQTAEEILKYMDIPIVFLSSHTEPEIVEKTEKITSYGYVVKNTGITVLDASIKMAFKLHEANKKNETEKIILRDVFESSLSGYWDWDMINNTEYLSPTFKKMFGYEDNEIPNSPEAWQKLIFPEDLPSVFETLNKHIQSKGKIPYYNEVRYRHKNGSTVWVICAGRVISWSDDGTPTRMIGCHIDITAQKNSENQLSIELQKINNILTSIPSGLFIYKYVEPDKLYLESGNDEAEKLTGISIKDCIGKEFNEIWYNKTKDKELTDHYINVAKTGQNIEFEDNYYQNSILKNIFKIRVFKIPENRLGVAFEDITKMKLSEEQLRASEEKFRSIFDNINIGVALHEIVVDNMNNPIDYIWLDCNHYYEIITGLNRSEILGKRRSEIIPNIDNKWLNSFGKVALTGENTIIMDYSIFLNRYLEVYVFSPGYGKFAVAMKDITERIQSEEKINALTSRQNAILSAVPDIIAEVDNNKIYTWLNKSGLDFFGEDAIGREAAFYFEGEQNTYTIVKPLFNGDPNVIYLESWQRRKDGEKRLLAWWCRVLKDINGNVTGALSTARDITDYRKAEQEIQRQLSEKEILLKEVHHRIKNNIASIVSLLKIQSESITNKEALNAIQETISRVECIQKVYETLLGSKDYRELTAKDYIENLANSVISIFPKKYKVVLKLQVEDIIFNINKLVSIGIILNELITNSMKYAFSDRQDGIIEITLKKDENNITLSYNDNGVGLPENFNMDKSKLGLMLVKMLAEQLKGFIEIESRNGFNFRLIFFI